MFKKAIFLKRLNRFIVSCELNGKKTEAYLPNPGRLWEILIPGRTLYLSACNAQAGLREQGKGLPYTVWAAVREGHIICLHTHYTNEVAKTLIQEGLIRDLEGYSIKDREFRIDDHRIDFLLSNGSSNLALEVKSCTLFHDGIAMFPDAVTVRGRRHLEVLSERGGTVLFIVHYPEARFFLPDFHTDPDFSETLSRFRDRLLIKPLSILWRDDMTFEFVRELPIPWYIYDREAVDRGSYMLCGRISRGMSLKIGSLGMLGFKAGYYVYVGSGMNSLSSRIKRHRSVRKSVRWHIDYVIPYLMGLRSVPIRSSEHLECLLSVSISQIADGYIPDFGSTDCGCESHLYWFRRNPFEDERFINVILEFRIGRLKRLINPDGQILAGDL